MTFERIKGRKSKVLEDMYNRTLVLELNDGEAYGGNLDGCDEGIIYLCNCRRLDKKRRKWDSHGRTVEYDGKVIEDIMPSFCLSDIQYIYVLPSDFDEEGIDMEDLLQLYIDPNYKIPRGIKCEGDQEKEHSTECDYQLHDALTLLASLSYNIAKDAKEKRKLLEATRLIRRRLIENGAKIP